MKTYSEDAVNAILDMAKVQADMLKERTQELEQEKRDWDYCQNEIEELHLKVQKYESAMQDFTKTYGELHPNDFGLFCDFIENQAKKFKELLK